ncbi:hypothetical protein BDL97_06G010500 [Sphagnum fallax]|nr:hypothetical protein BDL97_06G010500 [Sphagnum fallax]
MTVFSASFAPPEFFAGWGCSTIVRRKVLEKTDLNCVKNWCIAACSTQSPTRRFHDFSLKRLCVTKRCRATNLVGDMDGSDGGGLQMGVEIDMRELQDADAIVSLANDAGQISICGFGSLLSEKSARSTFPNLQNFRVGVLRDLRRVFIHATPVFFDRGIANLDTKEISSVCVEPCKGESIIVTVFEISASEVTSHPTQLLFTISYFTLLMISLSWSQWMFLSYLLATTAFERGNWNWNWKVLKFV